MANFQNSLGHFFEREWSETFFRGSMLRLQLFLSHLQQYMGVRIFVRQQQHHLAEIVGNPTGDSVISWKIFSMEFFIPQYLRVNSLVCVRGVELMYVIYRFLCWKVSNKICRLSPLYFVYCMCFICTRSQIYPVYWLGVGDISQNICFRLFF